MNNVKEFQKKYAKFFAERFVYSTAEVEKSDDKQIKKEQIACVLKAYKYLGTLTVLKQQNRINH